MDPNPQKSMRISNIPGPVQQSPVRAMLPVPSSYQAADHATFPQPRVSAASIARLSQIPSPPERAPPSADASRSNAAASSRLPSHSFTAKQVTSDAVPTQKKTATSAQPAASGKPTSVLQRPLSLPKGLLAPASGVSANREKSVSAAQAPACKAPFQARTSAQINVTASPPAGGEAASKSQSSEVFAAAAAACGALAACNGNVFPVPSTMAEVTDSVSKVPARPAQPAISPIAKRTRAATSEQVLSSPAKPVTSPPTSAMPAASPPGDSAAYDSDGSSDDEIDSPKNGAAAVSNPKSASTMLANPLYTRRCTISGSNAGKLTYTAFSLE